MEEIRISICLQLQVETKKLSKNHFITWNSTKEIVKQL